MKAISPGDAPADGLFSTSQLQFTGNFVAGDIQFAYRTSSEEGYDCLRFFIDGLAQPFATTCTYNHGGIGASGLIDWTYVQVPVSGGLCPVSVGIGVPLASFETQVADWVSQNWVARH